MLPSEYTSPSAFPTVRISWLHHIQAYWLTVNTSYGRLLHRMHDSLLAAWLSLTRWEFHPLNPATLPGRFRICVNAGMREKPLIRAFRLIHNPHSSHHHVFVKLFTAHYFLCHCEPSRCARRGNLCFLRTHKHRLPRRFAPRSDGLKVNGFRLVTCRNAYFQSRHPRTF